MQYQATHHKKTIGLLFTPMNGWMVLMYINMSTVSFHTLAHMQWMFQPSGVETSCTRTLFGNFFGNNKPFGIEKNFRSCIKWTSPLCHMFPHLCNGRQLWRLWGRMIKLLIDATRAHLVTWWRWLLCSCEHFGPIASAKLQYWATYLIIDFITEETPATNRGPNAISVVCLEGCWSTQFD